MSDVALPAWLDAGAAALAGAVPPAETLEGSLPGLARARSLDPLQRLELVQASGLAGSHGAGEPIDVAWRRFLRGHGPSTLVIDATDLSTTRGATAVLDGAPWLLAEGLLIAAGLRDTLTVELRLPAGSTGHEGAFLNAADAIRSLAQVATPRRQVVVVRDCHPDAWGDGRPDDGSRLSHSPETWCRIALLFAGKSGLDAAFLTLGRGLPERGLVEMDRTAAFRAQLDGWSGGVGVPGQEPLLVFDDGLGGLPLSKAGIPGNPGAFTTAGDRPGTVDASGAARRDVRGQTDRSRALPPLAARRRRARTSPLPAGAGSAPRHGDHPRTRERRASRPT